MLNIFVAAHQFNFVNKLFVIASKHLTFCAEHAQIATRRTPRFNPVFYTSLALEIRMIVKHSVVLIEKTHCCRNLM